MSKQSTIQHYFSLTPAGVPAGAGMTYGEIAINVADEKLFIENVNGDVISLSQTKDLSGAFAHSDQVVTSVNGATGAITDVVFANIGNTFTQTNTFEADIFVNSHVVGRGGGGDPTNIAIGATAMAGNDGSSVRNVGIGFGAAVNLIGNDVVSIGYLTMETGQSNTESVAIGSQSFQNANNADSSVGVGFQTLKNSTATMNTAIGRRSCVTNTTGMWNTGVGAGSLYSNDTGNRNIAIGVEALFTTVYNSYNIGVGVESLTNLTDGEQNIAIGSYAGKLVDNDDNLLGATGSIFIGHETRGLTQNQINEIVIGTHARGMGSNTAVIGATTQTAAYIYGTLNAMAGISASGATFTGNISAPNIVNSVNGSAGAITNVAFTNAAQTFTGLQTFANGITAVGGTFGNISAAGASFSSDIFVQGIRVGRGGAGDSNSVAIGSDVLPAGTFNVAIGKSALQAAVSPNNNVAIGWQSQMSGDSPINNVAVGANSLRFNQFGQGNVAIGYEALYTTNNNSNTAIGSMALRSTSTGIRNTSIGNESLYSNTSGVANVAIGHQAGRYRGEFTAFDFPNDLDNEEVFALSRTTGTGGIYIGQWSRASANGTVKEIVIGSEALGLGSNTAVIGATSQVSATIYGTLNLPGGLSASSGATFSGTVSSDTGYRITSSAINTQTGTSYSITGSDNGEILTFSNAAATTLTIPSGLPVGFNCTVIQLGAGQVGFTAAAGVTLNSYGNLIKIAGQHGAATVISYSSNIYNIAGTLST